MRAIEEQTRTQAQRKPRKQTRRQTTGKIKRTARRARFVDVVGTDSSARRFSKRKAYRRTHINQIFTVSSTKRISGPIRRFNNAETIGNRRLNQADTDLNWLRVNQRVVLRWSSDSDRTKNSLSPDCPMQLSKWDFLIETPNKTLLIFVTRSPIQPINYD